MGIQKGHQSWLIYIPTTALALKKSPSSTSLHSHAHQEESRLLLSSLQFLFLFLDPLAWCKEVSPICLSHQAQMLFVDISNQMAVAEQKAGQLFLLLRSAEQIHQVTASALSSAGLWPCSRSQRQGWHDSGMWGICKTSWLIMKISSAPSQMCT